MEIQTEALELFERHRPRLFGLSYRMLGSVEDAEDLVQEAYLRWHQADIEEVRSPEAWLVAVTTRLAIDRLRRAAAERARYPGNWLPEPIAGEAWSADRSAGQGSDLSLAFLLLLERLMPEERAAFLLRDVFDTDYAEIAEALDKSEAAVRQMVHRARTRVRQGRTRFTAPREVKERLLQRFLAAVHAGDKESLLALFTEDAVLVGDGGGKASASPRPIVGAERIAHLMLTVARKGGAVSRVQLTELNGEPSIVVERDGRVVSTMAIESDGERIVACYSVLNPDKLGRV
jgi:RNA polymerase sigma-70 factor, ECF subfamily